MNTSNKHTDTPKGKNYIFAIAIDEYQDRNISNLKYAVSDAEYLVEVLKCKYGFEDSCEGKSLVLTNADATQMNIHEHFVHLINSLEPDDSLVVYLAGHATQSPYEKGNQYKDGTGDFITHKRTEYEQGKFLPLFWDAISTELLVSYFVQMKARDVYLIADVAWSDKILDSESLIEFNRTDLGFRCGLVTERKLDMFNANGIEKLEERHYAKHLVDFLKKRIDEDGSFEYLLSRYAEDFYNKNKTLPKPVNKKFKISGKVGSELRVQPKLGWEKEIQDLTWEKIEDKLDLESLMKFKDEYENFQEVQDRISVINCWKGIAQLTQSSLKIRLQNSELSIEKDMIGEGVFDKIISLINNDEDNIEKFNQDNIFLLKRIDAQIDSVAKEIKELRVDFVKIETENGGFEISKKLISVGQFRAYCESNGIEKFNEQLTSLNDTDPINVSWQDANRFIGWYGGNICPSDVCSFQTFEQWNKAREKIDFQNIPEWCSDAYYTDNTGRGRPKNKQRIIIDNNGEKSHKDIEKDGNNLGFRIVKK